MINDPLTVLPTVGQKRYLLLRNVLGIATVRDLLYTPPYRYIDQSLTVQTSECREGDQVTVSGKITSVQISGYKRKILDITLADDSGTIHLIFFGGIRFYKNTYTEGMEITASGKVSKGRFLQIVHPEIEGDQAENIHTGRIIPVYSVPVKLRDQSISTRYLRKLTYSAIEYCSHIHDKTNFSEYYTKHNLMSLKDALAALHFPETMTEAALARKRLAYDELLVMQLLILYQKQNRKKLDETTGGQSIPSVEDFKQKLPFVLTADQIQCCKDIAADFSSPYPMNRLLQGDVGSGKTAVAAYALLAIVASGRQCALMAPTELLARQHCETLNTLLPELNAVLLTGKTPNAEKKEILAQLETGSLLCVVGTHALIQGAVTFNDLALVVIDEQHRFGLEQRVALRQKNTSVHLLTMSATPIPRTMAITLYGDMDISRILEKPHGRLPVKTMLLPSSKKSGVYNSMEKYVAQGRQCYYVVPMIEENDELELESVVSAFSELNHSALKVQRFGWTESPYSSIKFSESFGEVL